MTSKPIKTHKSYEDQVKLLLSRGMEIQNTTQASHILKTRNYYRLSGYWYSARIIDFASGKPTDNFQPGTSLDLCTELYEFDARLRSAVFTTLAHIELALRALLGYTIWAKLIRLCIWTLRSLMLWRVQLTKRIHIKPNMKCGFPNIKKL